MANHEFGIMQNAPKKGKRYDEYEPHKYNCISVNDDYIDSIADSLNDIDFYWHTLDIKEKGIAYCGITLIPPYSTKAFIDIINDVSELSKLRELLENALKENKWIIHFGL